MPFQAFGELLVDSFVSAEGFLRRALTSACFHPFGKVAVSIMALMMVMSAELIVGLPRLKTWWGQGSVGAPE